MTAADASLETVATRFARAPYTARLGLRVEEIALDRVRCRVPYKDENSNPGRVLHGGVAASAIDIAGALAAATGLAQATIGEAGTLDLSVVYLAAAAGEDIVIDARVLRRGKEISYCDVEVRSDGGKQIARGLVTHRLLDRPPHAGAERYRETPARSGFLDEAEVPPLARGFVSLPFMAGLGLRVAHMEDGGARVRMPFQSGNADHDGVVHEGAIAALVDTAGAMASWSIVGLDFRLKASTVGMHVSFHGPAVEEEIVAEARTWRRNDEIFLNQATVAGARSGRVVATGTVTYRIVV